MGDQRDAVTWVALELSRQGELKVEDGTLADEIRTALGVEADWPVFIPAKVYSKGGKKVTVHLMEGYAFVASGLDEVNYFKLESERKLVTKVMAVLSPSGVRVLSTISDRQVRGLRKQLLERIASDISSGMSVKVNDGKYKGLDGEVLLVEEDYAIVFIKLRSLETVAKIPRVFLEAKLETSDTEKDT